MPSALRLLWGRHGIYNLNRIYAKGNFSREAVLERLTDHFVDFNTDNGARIANLTSSDARYLYQQTFKSESIADSALQDASASPREVGLALRLKAAIAQTRIYLMFRDDWKEILESMSKLGDLSGETIPPIIEEHVENGFLDKDDIHDDFR